MVEQIDTFLELQKIDDELDKAKSKKRKLPLKMNIIKEKIQLTKNMLKDKHDEFKKLQVKMNRVELDIKEKTTKIEKHQEDLFGGKISDIKELKQLQKAIAKYMEDKEKTEETLLIFMEESDNFNKVIGNYEEDLKKKEEQFKILKTETDILFEKTTREIKSLQEKRNRLVAKIKDIGFLKKYELLRKDKGGDVILEVNDAICPGCYLGLPSDVVYHLKKDQSMVICPNCSRILIWNG